LGNGYVQRLNIGCSPGLVKIGGGGGGKGLALLTARGTKDVLCTADAALAPGMRAFGSHGNE